MLNSIEFCGSGSAGELGGETGGGGGCSDTTCISEENHGAQEEGGRRGCGAGLWARGTGVPAGGARAGLCLSAMFC